MVRALHHFYQQGPVPFPLFSNRSNKVKKQRMDTTFICYHCSYLKDKNILRSP